jgi:hypothetical protein
VRADREQGFTPVEVNASDTRNKADKGAKTGIAGKLSNAVKELVNNTALGAASNGAKKKVPRCPAVVSTILECASMCTHLRQPRGACCPVSPQSGR